MSSLDQRDERPQFTLHDQAPPRRIAHLDMDAFFASVELLRYPQLRGLPVVIGGRRRMPQEGASAADAALPLSAFERLRDYQGRGVITTATYAARAFGVGSAMGLMKAARLCPDAILLPVDFDAYRRYSRAFKDVVRSFAPVMEDRGIDEVYIDFTHVPGGQEQGGRVLAQRIQQGIHAATGLTCSIGVAPNKLLAKMASEFDKPQGISIVFADDLATRIWPLPCRKINGIGPKTDARLQALGIHTIGELAQQDLAALVRHFGKAYGVWLHEAAWGRDERAVVTESEPVSMSRETTFERDLHAVHDRASSDASSPRCASAWPPICSARVTAAARLASSCAMPTFAASRASRPSRCPRRTPPPFAAPPGNACVAWR